MDGTSITVIAIFLCCIGCFLCGVVVKRRKDKKDDEK